MGSWTRAEILGRFGSFGHGNGGRLLDRVGAREFCCAFQLAFGLARLIGLHDLRLSLVDADSVDHVGHLRVLVVSFLGWLLGLLFGWRFGLLSNWRLARSVGSWAAAAMSSACTGLVSNAAGVSRASASATAPLRLTLVGAFSASCD